MIFIDFTKSNPSDHEMVSAIVRNQPAKSSMFSIFVSIAIFTGTASRSSDSSILCSIFS